MNNDVVRVYPACCTSAQCGRLSCGGCRKLPILDEFKAWVKARAAVVEDKVWAPLVYTAKRAAGD